MTSPWDLLVVGGGSAGIVASKTAASLGARVLLVERARTGGDCLWTGCVPSKSLLAAAAAAAGARRASEIGVDVGDVAIDFARVMAHVRAAIDTIEPADSPETLEAAGVRVRSGDLTFDSPHSAVVDGEPIAFRQAVLCTGSTPSLPPIPGLDAASPLTSDTVWELPELPRRLAILGGGNIGCELGQAFARLGSTVTVVEGDDRILPREDAESAEIVAQALTRDGVTLVTGRSVTEVKPGADTGVLVLDDGDTVEFDRLLVAVGRTPGTAGLGLDAARVDLDERGYVAVDARLRTSNIDIWAAGDVIGDAQFTHTAGVNGSIAASNAVLGLRRRVDGASVPRVTFTDPEVAAVGVSPAAADTHDDLRVRTWRHGHLDRAVTETRVDGFTKLVVDAKGRILGATVVGPRAGETLGELTLAVRHGMTTRDVAGTTHAYPTYNDGAWNAAIADVQERLRSPGTARAIAVLAAGRRRWVRSRVRRAATQARSR